MEHGTSLGRSGACRGQTPQRTFKAQARSDMGGPRRIPTDVPSADIERGSPDAPISVLIVDDHLLFAEVIHKTL